MSPLTRSWKRLEGINIRRVLEASNLPIETATAIADLCELSTERIAEADKRANDAWMAAQMERESAEYWKAKASRPEEGVVVPKAKLQEWIEAIQPYETEGSYNNDGVIRTVMEMGTLLHHG